MSIDESCSLAPDAPVTPDAVDPSVACAASAAAVLNAEPVQDGKLVHNAGPVRSTGPLHDAAPLRNAESTVAAAYDAIAQAYDAQLCDELDGKPLDRALLDAMAELTSSGTLADVGCGPGQVARYLAARHDEVVGVDLSTAMIEIARRRSPQLHFEVASMLDLPVADAGWAGAVAFYSIIHLSSDQRARATRELARVVREDGWALVAFHVDSAQFATGQANHLKTWFDQEVDIYGFFLDPAEIATDLEQAGFAVWSTTLREPFGQEFASRRAYLLARRTGRRG